MVLKNPLTIRDNALYPRQTELILCLLLALGVHLANLPCDAAKRRFTVADDIGLWTFGVDGSKPFMFSPDGKYVEVETEHGRLDLNRAEATLRIFRTEDIRQFLVHPDIKGEPSAVWELSKSTYKDAPIISDVHWLADSSGFAFLAKTASGNNELLLADIRTKTAHALTSETQDVTAFDIRDENNFVYTVPSSIIRTRALEKSQAVSIVATGHFLDDLMFPESLYPLRSQWHDRSELWAVVEGKSFRVEDKSSGQPIPLYREGQAALSLAPDGRSVATALAVANIPQEWEMLYPPTPYSIHRRIKAGRQDLSAIDGQLYVSEYVVIDLCSGKVKPITNTPIADAAGWESFPSADWSADGQFVVLSNIFVPSNADTSLSQLSRPCVAVVDLVKGSTSCLERMKGYSSDRYEEGFHWINSVRFVPGSDSQVIVSYSMVDGPLGSTTYERASDQSWTATTEAQKPVNHDGSIEVSVKQDLNDPPVLVATDRSTNASRIFLEPNPQLKDIELGEASVFKWIDKRGRDWVGGLYTPPDYVRGRRYPLVIQPHGFLNHLFIPSGLFTSAHAARELAAKGIMVLQVADCPYTATPEEASCNVAGYEAAVERLAAEGSVDPNRLGIIGFSRTCYYVMDALTTSTLLFKAASVTSGVLMGYVNYIEEVDAQGNNLREEPVIYGAQPFGGGLQPWLKRSPEFNMDKVKTPLQVVAIGAPDVHWMWEPYAALRYLNKPVDLVVLTQEGTHPLTNPAQRMVSQGGTVDWFDFWLNGHEDPDPAKTEQYERWRELRRLQGHDKAGAQ